MHASIIRELILAAPHSFGRRLAASSELAFGALARMTSILIRYGVILLFCEPLELWKQLFTRALYNTIKCKIGGLYALKSCSNIVSSPLVQRQNAPFAARLLKIIAHQHQRGDSWASANFVTGGDFNGPIQLCIKMIPHKNKNAMTPCISLLTNHFSIKEIKFTTPKAAINMEHFCPFERPGEFS